MLAIGRYVKAQSLDEAYEFCKKKSSIVLGGMLWLKLQKRQAGTAVDLSGLGLDRIEETEDGYRIGAMATLRDLEKHQKLNDFTQGAIYESVKNIVGVQFRNLATTGGSVYGRFGFSDVLTILLALDAKVELFNAGTVAIEDFINMPRSLRDILVSITVPKEPVKAVYMSQRNISTDFPVLTLAFVKREDGCRVAVGARPMPAVLVKDENGILKDDVKRESAEAFAEYVAENVRFGSSLRAGKEYRKEIAKVLVKRAAGKLESRS